jgi:hypothetical protein
MKIKLVVLLAIVLGQGIARAHEVSQDFKNKTTKVQHHLLGEALEMPAGVVTIFHPQLEITRQGKTNIGHFDANSDLQTLCQTFGYRNGLYQVTMRSSASDLAAIGQTSLAKITNDGFFFYRVDQGEYFAIETLACSK